ncbi:unnamed protein product [Fraxinus pennsylvanica]|uniref:HPP transmembrane region domain-containing protein n=1 Tax=Fraxinus pennsylvanica TaxID=56036 RepID=A0AAD2DN66_9LAMI|nr:unnamed protein product [Fraxinus pennsylvanica]
MGVQLHASNAHIQLFLPRALVPSLHRFSPLNSLRSSCNSAKYIGLRTEKGLRKRKLSVVASSTPSLSDIFWPSAGAFVAMAILGKIDQILVPKGISMTIAPLGAVCAVLYATPSSPGARKYNMFVAQIGCAAIGVLAFSVFGPGWLARSAALSAALAFMIFTRAVHPPAASLPLLFIDGVKLHHLNFWYSLFPGAAGCVILCLIQEIVCYLKENFKF